MALTTGLLCTCKASWTRSITVRMGELVNCPPFSLASTLSLELGPQMAPTSRVQTHNRYGCYIYLWNIHPICTELSVLAIRLPFGGGAEEDVFPGEGLVLREVLPVYDITSVLCHSVSKLVLKLCSRNCHIIWFARHKRTTSHTKVM